MTWSVGVANSSSNNSAATGATITGPSGTSSGDCLLAWVIACDPSGGTLDAGAAVFPAGWSNIYSTSFPGNFNGTSRVTIAMRTATGADAGGVPYAVTWTNSTNYGWCIVNITPTLGITITLDQIFDNVYDTGPSNVSMVTPALTGLAAANDLWIGSWFDCGGVNPYTLPSSPVVTILNNNTGDTNFGFIGIGYQLLAANSASAQTTTNSFGSYNDSIAIALFQSTPPIIQPVFANTSTVIMM